jgi:precorrin-6B methylase 2
MNQTPFHDIHNATLLDLIPTNAKKIVEVGCMSGALAREYKKRNPTCYYFGIDINSEYAQRASSYCDRVDSFDIESKDGYFFDSLIETDCWVFGDVLEHLTDPWGLLKKIKARMSIGDCVVACLPNAQNWYVITKLLSGDFRYEDQGLLDRTHLRWFTRKTAIELFTDTGLDVESVVSRSLQSTVESERVIRLLAKAAEECGGSSPMANSDITTFQYVIKATRRI